MNDDAARNRWFLLNLARILGVALVITGLLVTQGTIGWPIEVGYVLIVLGIIDAFVAPQFLARRWRSPKE
ncbi:hypothetical protein [Allopontixanthobacter sediminis]|uniref:Uncharacterized protein n=1 Tax=Allopontixanthobacter sediminis TaxID=1689985 RepID=A0A845B3C1_9SPHN|nr:hypothetical protein [Allopontixanthobacter sediminis]MXP45115.1 hypothetical protein [Allopontixanthobacter sediminis]